MTYQAYDCEQLSVEAQRLSAAAAQRGIWACEHAAGSLQDGGMLAARSLLKTAGKVSISWCDHVRATT